jgi:3-hydroxybutyryl-CoA dehydratase
MLQPGDNWFEDAEVGDRYTTGAITITESHIVTFAGLSGDFFDLHMDEQFAQELGFKGRVAHGLLGLAMVDGLKNRASHRFRAVASLNWRWTFSGPILIGDRIQGEIIIIAKRETKRPDRGIVTLAFKVTKQDGSLVQQGENDMMVLRRPKA